MSYTLVDRILRTPMSDPSDPLRVTAAEKAVLVYMASHADDDGREIWCSAPTIATHTSLPLRNVQRAIAGLRTKGFLVDAPPRARPNQRDRRVPVYDINHRHIGGDRGEITAKPDEITAKTDQEHRHIGGLSSTDAVRKEAARAPAPRKRGRDTPNGDIVVRGTTTPTQPCPNGHCDGSGIIEYTDDDGDLMTRRCSCHPKFTATR